MTEAFNHFMDIAEQLDKAMGQVVRKTCFDVQGTAQQLCRVRTGFTRSSIYVETSEDSTYGQVTGEGTLAPEIEKPADDKTGYIAVGSEAGIYLEMGTRYMPPSPFIVPAVEQHRDSFEQAFAAIESQLK